MIAQLSQRDPRGRPLSSSSGVRCAGSLARNSGVVVCPHTSVSSKSSPAARTKMRAVRLLTLGVRMLSVFSAIRPSLACASSPTLSLHGGPHKTTAIARNVPDSPMTKADLSLIPIGWVESPLTDPADAPKQGREGAPDAHLVLDASVLEGLEGVVPGARVIVLTWLDRARRDVLRVHPRDDPRNPERGVFSTRSADRPNPIGLHEVEVLSIDGERVRVGGLEAVNGTPILDVKPVIQT